MLIEFLNGTLQKKMILPLTNVIANCQHIEQS